MLDSLEHLERISVSVFQKITDKVTEQRNTLQKVQQRAAVCKKAVEWVQKERKNEATRVLSSPHYPDKDISNVEYSPTFAARDRIGIQQMEFHKFNPGPNNILFNHKLYNPIEHFEKSPTRQNKQSHNKIPKKLDEGVGKLPFKNVQSVSELLCFNTNMNVYHKYHGADPLQANYHTTMMMMAMEGTSNKNDKNHDFASANNLYIDPAPPSLSKDSIYDMYWGSSASQEQNIKAFAPTRRELPMFEFPSNLGLPNIVDTAQWDLSLDNMPSIAPSSLPSLDLGNNNSTTSLNTNAVPSSIDPTSSSIPSVPTNVPPPPVTSTGVVPPPPVTMGNVPPPPVMSSSSVPPPPSGVPQPPSIPIVTPSAEGTGDNDTDENENTESGGGDRSDLLASIRNFSKNKLKKANKIRDKESSKEASAPQKSSGGDMMTDLFRKIGLRRNAIEGSKDEKKPKKKKKEKKPEEPIPPVPTPNLTPNSTAPDSSAATELPKMPPPPKRPQSEDDSDGSDVDSW
ncbi:hypothetical protein NAEGRDRAFT_77687 [Naegleria gruberi]|uniref:Uncharacterized protein AM5 n=1 Tax=Naegleria gruberi TaxID=5762 RepID=D2UXK8_NAEGR|nr:uncharacterized protein NAEGRDRAFT_77687 [Naegleria gruberi]EFC50651.1 hypothetical protein NAEGRDRAFT_77687 [Naegleria gruberi]|eukprot:XP_002683395.1 hypothetical protein NAEGRDRAFT_77687 [Naegleria gruberi strain NEG-M]